MEREQLIARLVNAGVSERAAIALVDTYGLAGAEAHVTALEAGSMTVAELEALVPDSATVNQDVRNRRAEEVRAEATRRGADANTARIAGEIAASDEGERIAEENPEDEIAALLEAAMSRTEDIPIGEIAQRTGIVPNEEDIEAMIEAYNQASGEFLDHTNSRDVQNFFFKVTSGDPLASVAAELGMRGHVDNFVRITAGEGKVLDMLQSEWDDLRFHWARGADQPLRARELAFALAQANRAEVPGGALLAARRLLGLDRPADGVSFAQAIENISRANLDPTDPLGTAFEVENLFSDARDRYRSGSEALQLRRYFETYNDWSLAIIALADPSLAQRIYEQGGAFDPEDANEVRKIFRQAGWVPREDGTIPGVDDFDMDKYRATLGGGGLDGSGDGPTAAEVNLPDPASLRESYRNLYRSWFQLDPDEAELSAFVSEINSSMVAEARRGLEQRQGINRQYNIFKGERPDGAHLITDQNVDPMARMRERLRARPEYEHLFGNMPEGLSEEEYAAQFASRAAQLLGPELNPSAVRTGMETGDVNDTARQIFWGQGGDAENTTFLARLARMGQVFRSNT